MKLKNKKTGKIEEVIVSGYPVSGKTTMFECSVMDANEEDGYKTLGTYASLAELNAEWEDAPEEPKELYWINYDGSISHAEDGTMSFKKQKSIGNHFGTREEAEKAVEKLKAFKRLKDKGFRFTLTPGVGSLDIEPDKFQIEINAEMPAKWFCCDAVQKDLDDCFGGEE